MCAWNKYISASTRGLQILYIEILNECETKELILLHLKEYDTRGLQLLPSLLMIISDIKLSFHD